MSFQVRKVVTVHALLSACHRSPSLTATGCGCTCLIYLCHEKDEGFANIYVGGGTPVHGWLYYFSNQVNTLAYLFLKFVFSSVIS